MLLNKLIFLTTPILNHLTQYDFKQEIKEHY